MNPMDSIIQQVHLAAAERMALNEALRDEAKIVLKQINEVIVDFDKAASHIYKSSDFTREGKKSHIGKLALDYQERLEHITNSELESLRRHPILSSSLL